MECRCDSRFKPGVKARQHPVILMQNMHPLASRTFDAAVPAASQTQVLCGSGELDPLAGDGLDQGGHIHSGGTIIHYLDLHLLRTGVLLENAMQSFL